jgi:hypothetical protein
VLQQTVERAIAGLWALADVVANPRLCRPAHSRRQKRPRHPAGLRNRSPARRDNDRRWGRRAHRPPGAHQGGSLPAADNPASGPSPWSFEPAARQGGCWPCPTPPRSSLGPPGPVIRRRRQMGQPQYGRYPVRYPNTGHLNHEPALSQTANHQLRHPFITAQPLRQARTAAASGLSAGCQRSGTGSGQPARSGPYNPPGCGPSHPQDQGGTMSRPTRGLLLSGPGIGQPTRRRPSRAPRWE